MHCNKDQNEHITGRWPGLNIFKHCTQPFILDSYLQTRASSRVEIVNLHLGTCIPGWSVNEHTFMYTSFRVDWLQLWLL